MKTATTGYLINTAQEYIYHHTLYSILVKSSSAKELVEINLKIIVGRSLRIRY